MDAPSLTSTRLEPRLLLDLSSIFSGDLQLLFQLVCCLKKVVPDWIRGGQVATGGDRIFGSMRFFLARSWRACFRGWSHLASVDIQKQVSFAGLLSVSHHVGLAR
jgi:hypothetical protein